MLPICPVRSRARAGGVERRDGEAIDEVGAGAFSEFLDFGEIGAGFFEGVGGGAFVGASDVGFDKFGAVAFQDVEQDIASGTEAAGARGDEEALIFVGFEAE